jgi:NhaP-type Na+/H+ or K+/H+ antiporter
MAGVILLVAFVIGYALVSKFLSTTPLTGPILFMAFGLLAGPELLDVVTVELSSEVVQLLLEITLVVILFTDAAIIDVRAVGRNLFVPARLLTVGLVLTMAAGIAMAYALFGGIGFWAAAVIAVLLAPTDAALGQAVVTNERVPQVIRQGLSVESGLNDGIVVPFLAIALAGAAGEMQTVAGIATVFLEEIGVALIVGLAIGWIGGRLMVFSYERGWMSREWRQVSVPLLAALCFLIADPLHGSGFMAAFVGGLTFGHILPGKLSSMRWRACRSCAWCPSPWLSSARSWRRHQLRTSDGSARGGLRRSCSSGRSWSKRSRRLARRSLPLWLQLSL